MTGRVLVVDDEPRIRDILVAYLAKAGYDTDEAEDGATALTLAATTRPDAVLLDLGLPDLDGLEVLRRLRTFSEVPVIVITARDEEVDTIAGLTVGADDYVTKPFGPREVVARLSALMRRTRRTASEEPPASPTRGLVLDADRREVEVDGRVLAPSALEFDLLAAFYAKPGRVFSRRQLLSKVWGYDFYGDERVVDVHIRGLRKLLGDDAADPRFIATVRGVGYKLLQDRS